MIKVRKTLPPLDRLPRLLRGVALFFGKLQWKLTLAYTLFTVITILILGAIALAFVWYTTFLSNTMPNRIADGLLRVGPALTPYLEQTPPDQAGLQAWLQKVTLDNDLVISIPKDDAVDETDTVAAQFGRFATVAIVDAQGQILAAVSGDEAAPDGPFQTQLSPEAAAGFQAALQGETDPALLSARDADNYLVATAPILGPEEQVLGAIFVKTALPFEQGEFLRIVLQGTILPVAVVMLIAGVIAGVLFGFMIARGLTRRLQTLAEAADAWSEGNFEVLARDSSGDELGTLARQLNHMAVQLQTLFQTNQELAALEERNRLARDLHDSVKQQVFATVMQVGAAQASLDHDPGAARTHLAETERLVRQAQQELTVLIQELRPAALEGKGLATALRDYAVDWSRQNNIEAGVRVSGERVLPLHLEQALFRVAQEALANVARHSRATTAEIYLSWEGDDVVLTITNNGQGFDVAAMVGKGMGLRSMRERMEALGGHLAVDSQPSAGTRVTARLGRAA
jgi:NarL family two-component system sensor histidine kinase LiaS